MSVLRDLSYSVDSVIRDLRGSTPGIPRETLVQHAVYYLPLLRNDLNVPLLLNELLQSRNVLADPTEATPVDISIASYLADGLSAAIKRKKEITNPTIPFDEWVNHVIRVGEATGQSQTNNWRATILFTGLIQSKALGGHRLKHCELLLVRMCNEIMHADNIGLVSPVIILMLAKAQWSFSPTAIDHVDYALSLPRALDLVYLSPDGLNRPLADISRDAVAFRHWSGLSHVIRFSVAKERSFNNIDDALNKIELFARSILRHWTQLPPNLKQAETTWAVLKQLLFGISLQLEGFGELLLHAKAFPSQYFATKILRVLSPLSFIVTRIGSGGFDSYNFVYRVCMDTLVEYRARTRDYDNELSLFIRFMSGSTSLGSFYDEPGLSQLVYLLDLYETLLPALDAKMVEEVVLPVTRSYLTPVGDPKATKVLFESAHSVMLAYFSLAEYAGRITDEDIKHYYTTVLSLFPGPLSSKQFRVAINTIFSAVNNPARNAPQFSDWLYDQLYAKAKSIFPGIPIEEPVDDSAVSSLTPPTIRAVVISCLIHALPSLEPPEFQFWLPRVASMWGGLAYSESVDLENRFLDADIRLMITSEIDLSLSDIGIAWLDHVDRVAPRL